MNLITVKKKELRSRFTNNVIPARLFPAEVANRYKAIWLCIWPAQNTPERANVFVSKIKAEYKYVVNSKMDNPECVNYMFSYACENKNLKSRKIELHWRKTSDVVLKTLVVSL